MFFKLILVSASRLFDGTDAQYHLGFRGFLRLEAEAVLAVFDLAIFFDFFFLAFFSVSACARVVRMEPEIARPVRPAGLILQKPLTVEVYLEVFE